MFQVRWVQTALDELATVWMLADSASRHEITAASHTIDQNLKTEPHQKGESRADDERIYLLPPLGLLFEVDSAASLVWVLHVWHIRQNP